MAGLYVDNSMGIDNKEFEEFSKRTESKFDSKPISVPLLFAFIEADRINIVFIMRQTKCIINLKKIQKNNHVRHVEVSMVPISLD